MSKSIHITKKNFKGLTKTELDEQAEDGIRDFEVTGVQTCALPICIIYCWWIFLAENPRTLPMLVVFLVF